MVEQSTEGVIDVYSSKGGRALRRLAEEGIGVENLSVVTQNLQATTEIHGFVPTGDVAKSGVGDPRIRSITVDDERTDALEPLRTPAISTRVP